MIRVTRYSMSAAAVLVFLAAGAWLMFFNHGARIAWAEAIDRLAQIRTATCSLHTYDRGFGEVSKAYLEGSRVRIENPNRFYVIDFLEGKEVCAERSEKTATIIDLKKQPEEWIVLGSNPLNDLVEMKNAPAERLPDERIDDTLCQVYRVKDTAFIGYKVPWVKLWLDPNSKLPVQIHSVVADRQAMTFNDFHWNEQFDSNLLELVVPKGYRLLESPEGENASETATSASAGGVATQDVSSTVENTAVKAGREIPTDEIAKTIDMLGQRIEANYKAIESWSGSFDLEVHDRYTRDPQYEEISHAAVQFYADLRLDRIRINYRTVEPIRIIGNSHVRPTSEHLESRWVRTAEELLRFPVSDLQHTVEGFPRIEGFLPGRPFRVLYREPFKAAAGYGSSQGYVDPCSFFGDGMRYWTMCTTVAGRLRGEHGYDMEYARRNIVLRERSSAGGVEYVLIQNMKPVGSGNRRMGLFVGGRFQCRVHRVSPSRATAAN